MSLLKKIYPPPKWRIPVIILLGAISGLGVYIVNISNATSYLSDDPKTCINCHVMTAEYITWDHSSHREVATCNDCHVPHDNVFNKYYFKAKDGLYHASIFTMRMEPQAIVMKEASAEVVQSNCVRCHKEQVTDAKMASWVFNHEESRTERTCWECHQYVPHGRVKSLSAVGYHLDPLAPESEKKSIVPDWLDNAINNPTIK
ncbi:cytochrome c nitrite reductase small subunit [Reichenbachiella versicolor]|uniref:cytochrome c nitrite reductase small subunit n=1 Tax=Reichenbachiella versicolor TaxID=1821036 RepID=UPI000D6E01BF|nr:cytochrome c nitrite reductase small subunit [Reichenbachiella versicolor]